MYALSHNICCRRLCELSLLQNGLQLEKSVWFPRQKETFFVSPLNSSWAIQQQRDTFHSFCFHFLVTDCQICVQQTLHFLFFNFRIFRLVILRAIMAVLFPTKIILCDRAAPISVGLLHILRSLSTVQKWLALGWLESLNCPQVWACQRRSCARYSWRLLGSAPVCPVTLMRNKRELTEK